jgi:hypothetical protein
LTLAEHIARLQTDLMALNEHGTQSLAALTKGRARLFQSLFVFENYPMPAAPAAPNLTSWCRALAPWWRRWSFLSRLVVSSRGETLQLRLEFDGEQIPEARAEAVLADWLAELGWLAQADLSQPASVVAAQPR